MPLVKFHHFSPLKVPSKLKFTIRSESELIFDFVAVGGTFDHLHVGIHESIQQIGHKILLTMAAFLTEKKLTVGVMGKVIYQLIKDVPIERVKRKKAYEYMEAVNDRLKNVQSFLERVNRNIEYNVVPITDDFGPTITDKTLQALVGSLESYNGCKLGKSKSTKVKVNEERIKMGFSPLKLFTIDVMSSGKKSVLLEDMEHKISSSYIRQYISKIKPK